MREKCKKKKFDRVSFLLDLFSICFCIWCLVIFVNYIYISTAFTLLDFIFVSYQLNNNKNRNIISCLMRGIYNFGRRMCACIKR